VSLTVAEFLRRFDDVTNALEIIADTMPSEATMKRIADALERIAGIREETDAERALRILGEEQVEYEVELEP
jgi:hypothetical protein